ncbi:FAD binding domain-containing protein [Desulfosarcina ovata]|uniref:Molybdopterin dehydrogenase n=1 Tax=Desulfosarcina ovata subsp. ovata TaxID=2752305 RepID=A0A5K8AHJ9_9BACT|nr:FAD binding domain-containing protein [Desulfosarcina ovata]BBO91340.1 molybdopterin dehydrogenase [Desulfosarcina ovata subsp. ovata]
MKIEFQLNGRAVCLDAPADRRAVDLLREDLGFTGVKEGCGAGECGACAVLINGRTRLSCLMTAAQLSGQRVTTIEGLSENGTLHPVQKAFMEKGAVQCGFCTPGMILTTMDFLSRNPDPRRPEAAAALSGNLCRCTGYEKILDAVLSVDLKQAVPRSGSGEETAGTRSVTVDSKEENPRPVFLPESLEALWQLLAAHPEARVFSGGTDLLVWLRSKKINPRALVCLDRIDALRGIVEHPKEVWIGAGTTHEALLEAPAIARFFPVLAQALKTLGSPHIRRMGTLGGNIVTASPAGDTLPPLVVLGAQVVLASGNGTRRLALDAFIHGPGKTALVPGEIVSGIVIPKPEEGLLQHFEKVGLRKAMACAVASLAALLAISPDGRIEKARFAWGSVGPGVLRFPDIEASLAGRPFSRESLDAVIPAVRERVAPIDDVRASAEYRRRVAGNLMLRLPTVFTSENEEKNDGTR